MTDLNYTSKLSTLSPAPPPTVSAWGRQNSIITNEEPKENLVPDLNKLDLATKDSKTSSKSSKILASKSPTTINPNNASNLTGTAASPIDQELASNQHHHLNSKVKQTGKEKWVPIEADISVATEGQKEKSTANNNANKKKKSKTKHSSKESNSSTNHHSKSSHKEDDGGEKIENSIKDISKAAENTLEIEDDKKLGVVESKSDSSISTSAESIKGKAGIDSSDSWDGLTSDRHHSHRNQKSRNNSSGNVNNRSNGSNNRNSSASRHQSYSSYSPQGPFLNSGSPIPHQQLAPPFPLTSQQQYQYYSNYGPYKYYGAPVPQQPYSYSPQQASGFQQQQQKPKNKSSNNSASSSIEPPSNTEDSELLSSPVPQSQTNMFSPPGLIPQFVQQPSLVILNNGNGNGISNGDSPKTPDHQQSQKQKQKQSSTPTSTPISPSQFPDSPPHNLPLPLQQQPPHLTPLQQQGYIDPSLYYPPGFVIQPGLPGQHVPPSSSSPTQPYPQSPIPFYMSPSHLPPGLPPMQPYMGPGNQYMPGSTNPRASYSGNIQAMYPNGNSRSYSVVDDKLSRLTKQIEYYFSQANLIKDVYLRQHMNSEGFVTIQFIASFQRVSSILNSDNHSNLLLQAIKSIDTLELEGKKVRVKEGWEKWVLPKDKRIIKD